MKEGRIMISLKYEFMCKIWKKMDWPSKSHPTKTKLNEKEKQNIFVPLIYKTNKYSW